MVRATTSGGAAGAGVHNATTTTAEGDAGRPVAADALYMGNVAGSDPARACHEKLGHIGPAKLQSMVRKGLITGAGGVSSVRPGVEDQCLPCLRAKQTRARVRRGPSPHEGRQAAYPGELVHVDVVYCRNPTWRGYHYTLLCTDAATRERWGEVLPSKAHVAEAYRRYTAWLRTQWGGRDGHVVFRWAQLDLEGDAPSVRVVRLDNGGEFTSAQFRRFLAEEGTVAQYTSPYTPEHNGVAERTNRAAWDMCRTVMLQSGADTRWWGVCLLNYCLPTLNMYENEATGSSAYYDRRGVAPDIGSLHPFGCSASIHIPFARRTGGNKLAPRSEDGVFLGYSTEGDSYVVHVLGTVGTIRTTRDVVFHDRVFPWLARSSSSSSPPSLASGAARRLGPDSGAGLRDGTGWDDPLPVVGGAACRPPAARRLSIVSPVGPEQGPPLTRGPAEEVCPQGEPPATFTDSWGQTVQRSRELRIVPPRSLGVGPGPVSLPPSPPCPPPALSPARAPPASPPSVVPPRRSRRLQEVRDRQESCRDEGGGRDGSRVDYASLLWDDDPPVNYVELMREGGIQNEAYLSSLSDCFDLGGERSVMFIEVDGAREEEVLAVYVPKSYRSALECPDSLQWKAAINAILDQLESSQFAHFVPRAPGMHVIPSHYVFAYKEPAEEGGEGKYKVRLVLDGSKQVRGISFVDSWAPSLPHAGWRLFLHICAVEDLELQSLDFSNAFIQVPMSSQGARSPKVYVKVPPGMDVPPGMVLELDRALEGSRQAGNLWYKFLRRVLRRWGFVPLDTAETIYVKGSLAGGDFQMLAIHVDDVQVASQSVALQQQFLDQLGAEFKYKLSPTSRFVGYDLERDRVAKTIKVTAASKIAHILDQHGLQDVHLKFTPCAPGVHMSADSSSEKADLQLYQALVGAFMFVKEFRPDINFSVGKLSRFLACPNADHMDAALYLAGYLRRTPGKGMVFGGSRDYRIRIISDSDHGNCPDSGRSTSGIAVFAGDSLIIHKSKLQHITTLGAPEAELVALVLSVCEARWARAMLWQLVGARDRMQAYTDCMAVVHMANHQKGLQRTRHLNIKRHFLHDEVSEERLSVEHIPGKYNFTDVFTKPQNRVLFERNVEMLNVC